MSIIRIPAGITPDNSAEWGFFGGAANINNYSETYQTAATSGTNITLTTTQTLCGALFLTTGASGPFTITLPSTVALIAALGNTIATDGTYSIPMWITNVNIGQTGTLTVGDASTTLGASLNATIATNTTRKFLLQVASATTITIWSQGALSV